MFVAGIVVAAAVLLFLLGLLAPHVSKRAQRLIDHELSSAAGEALHAPGRAGKWLAKPFLQTEKGADKSSSAGRKTRFKLPF